MSTELVKHTALEGASLPDMVRYAEQLANANLLPGQYRKQPANVLYAMEYGRTLGITPLAAITGIHVIEGKPSASAALISGLVRQAGHRLRVRMENGTAVATIHRSDDPEFEFRAEWTMDRAKNAGLANKDVWKKYPQAMLKARAISEVARDACEEVLFGLHYTPEEIGANVDAEGLPMDAEVQQLRRIPAGESDPWATPAPAEQQGGAVRVGNVVIDSDSFVPHPEGQTIAEAAAKDDKTKADIKKRWATATDVINSGITAPDTGQPDVLGTYLTRLAGTLPAVAPAADEGVVDAQIVDDAAAAEQRLRAIAQKAGLPNIDEEFERSYGLPIAEAGATQINEMTSLIEGAA